MNRRKTAIAIFLMIMFLVSIRVFANADERILNFDSTIVVRSDGSLKVTEVIQVNSEGKSIKRGIYRDFPTNYITKWRFNELVPFEVVEVLRDGRPEPYVVEGIEGGKRVRIGDKKILLKHRIHTYSITYTTDFQLLFSDDSTELYWNVTGNYWEFPIDSATAKILLPSEARDNIRSYEGYTGRVGETNKDYKAFLYNEGALVFLSTTVLNPATQKKETGEGLTISVTWPAGLIKAPTPERLRKRFMSDNWGYISGAVGLVVVFVYFIIAWFIAGRDPKKGVIIPLYESPEGLSPASLRFIQRMGYDDRTFAAAIVGLAVRGHCTITESGRKYTVKKIEKEDARLSAADAKILDNLFKKKNSITLDESNQGTISGTINSLRNLLSREYEKKYFFRNMRYFLPGMILSILAVALLFISEIIIKIDVFLLGYVLFCTIILLFLLYKTVLAWVELFRSKGGLKKAFERAGAVVLTAILIPFSALQIGVTYYYLVYSQGNFWILLVLLLLSFINLIFYYLLKAPTRLGRELMDKIEGFKLFLNVTERDRLNIVMRPEKTPEIFERFLPYAIALGVENGWSKYFSSAIAAAVEAGTYKPTWYTGAALTTTGLGVAGMTSSLGDSFSRAITTSSTPPGSSSGGGDGGGSSGGGGGGGGGGGW